MKPLEKKKICFVEKKKENQLNHSIEKENYFYGLRFCDLQSELCGEIIVGAMISSLKKRNINNSS